MVVDGYLKGLEDAVFQDLDIALRHIIVLLYLLEAQTEILHGRRRAEEVERARLGLFDSLLTLHTFKPESVAPNREPE